MTMKLDIVTNDAGEGVRREHARELGAGVVVAIYRLAKLAQLHDLTNQAFTRQLEQTHQIIGDYCLRSGSNVNVMFAHKAIFVAGQLLKGSRGTYEVASELADLFEKLGGSELSIQRDLTRDELRAFAEHISSSYRTASPVSARGSGGAESVLATSKIRLRPVADAARLRGLELETLSSDERIVRTYASAVVVMRRFFEDLHASRYILPRRIKRIAQSLVDLSEGSTPAFLGVTEVRNANFDEAGRAVNTAILAVAMSREVTSDRAILSQIAMAAMMHDVARPRAMALSSADEPDIPGMVGPTTLSEDQEDRLAAGAAAVLTALGRVNEPSITRTVLAFEALWLRRETWLGPVYWGARAPTLHAKVIAVARLYNDLLTPLPGLVPPAPDDAVVTLAEQLQDSQGQVVLRMLVSALGLIPIGTVVLLSTGEMAAVVRSPRDPLDKPRVRLLAGPNGEPVAPLEIEMREDASRRVERVIRIDGWRANARLEAQTDERAHDEGWDDVVPESSGAAKAESPRSRRARDEVSSSSAIGSTPSAVAAAMGRMIRDSLHPVSAEETDGSPSLAVGVEEDDELAQRLTARPSVRRESAEATARGTFGATPLPHVLVYMLDHALSGSVIIHGSGGDETLHFVNGVPAKVRVCAQVALLGEVLAGGGMVEANAMEQAVVAAGRHGMLLGEYLVGRALVSPEALAWALEAQILERIAHLANLSPEMTYAYYRGVDLLDGWGGKAGPQGCPISPVLASVRPWTDRARVRATLNRIRQHPLRIHGEADLSELALLPLEQATLAVIRAESVPFGFLLERAVADESVVSSLVYSLAVTRQFAFEGQEKGPMAPRAARPLRPGGAAARVPSGAAAPVSGAPPASVPRSPPRLRRVDASTNLMRPAPPLPSKLARPSNPPSKPPAVTMPNTRVADAEDEESQS